MQQDAQRLYPAYQVVEVYHPRRADLPASITLKRGNRNGWSAYSIRYTGADLGSPSFRRGSNGPMAGGSSRQPVGGTDGASGEWDWVDYGHHYGAYGHGDWWPGIRNWRRSMKINWKASFLRFNWDTHSALGFWFSLFMLMWSDFGNLFFVSRSVQFVSERRSYFLAVEATFRQVRLVNAQYLDDFRAGTGASFRDGFSDVVESGDSETG